jgi:hypothetical protein
MNSGAKGPKDLGVVQPFRHATPSLMDFQSSMASPKLTLFMRP